MNDKYIIRNCPSTYQNFDDKFVCTTQRKEKVFPFYCMDCADCVLKQIVNECVNSLRFSCERILAEKLLGLLEIQEVE